MPAREVHDPATAAPGAAEERTMNELAASQLTLRTARSSA
jgi:hypothetical protein